MQIKQQVSNSGQGILLHVGQVATPGRMGSGTLVKCKLTSELTIIKECCCILQVKMTVSVALIRTNKQSNSD